MIGNSDYQYTAPLANPLHDAADVGTSVLKKLGFMVVKGCNLDKVSIDRPIRDFGNALTAQRSVLFFAFSLLEYS